VLDYDATLKVLLKGSAAVTIQTLSGLSIARWHDVELSSVEQSRVDLLGESIDGRLLHLELKSTNDPSMALRMAEYGLKIARLYGRYPKQVLLYVGEPPLRMASAYAPNESVSFHYKAVDIRELDADSLLKSEGMGDNVIAILTKLRDESAVVRRIVERIVTGS